MWSLAGNLAVDQPIQQLCSWDTQAVAPAAFAWDAGARLRAGSGFSRLGFRTLASSFVLGKRTSSRPCAWGAHSPLSHRLCAWGPDPADLGLSLSGGRGRPGTESGSTREGGFGPVGGAANLCSRCSGRFQVWAPLRGFKCGSRSLICSRACARARLDLR